MIGVSRLRPLSLAKVDRAPDHHHSENTMKTDLYSRMFARLDDLIPGLSCISDTDAAFYAKSRNGELALFGSVSLCSGHTLELELAHDEVIRGVEQTSPWMKFRIDLATQTARLIAYQTGSSYEVIKDETIYPKSSNLPLNLFAVNWLGILVNLHLAFHAVAPAEMN
jgi:hypothetical protein